MDEVAKLKEENQTLKDADAKKSEMISVSAHQMRTSLSALKWILKMLIDGDVGPLSDEQTAYIKKAYDSNERMIGVVGSLLALNHGEAAKADAREKIDIASLVEQVLLEFSGETFNKGIELTLEKPEGGMPVIECDCEHLRIVIENLVENAIKYSFPHGKIRLALRYDQAKNEILLSVHDDGIGISAENQSKVFEKFFRGDNAKKKEPGTGLGLYATKKIIEEHKGTIRFESNPGGGTTFFVVLPVA